MRVELLRLDLRLRRRMLVGTAMGVAAYLLVVLAVYPSFKHDTALTAMIEANPSVAAAIGITGSITSPAGWLSANLYANFGPLLALMLTIGYGSAAIAGQDSDGLLGLTITLPATRTRIMVQKAGALLLVALVVPAASFAVCLTGPWFQLSPDWGPLTAASLALALLAFDVGAVALLVGALTGSRGAALGIATGFAAVAYLVSSLAPTIPAIHALRWVSPFFWAVGDDQVAHGVTPPEWAALLCVGLLVSVAAVAAFRRLDVH